MAPSLPLLDLAALASLPARPEAGGQTAALPDVFLELFDGCLEEVEAREPDPSAPSEPTPAATVSGHDVPVVPGCAAAALIAFPGGNGTKISEPGAPPPAPESAPVVPRPAPPDRPVRVEASPAETSLGAARKSACATSSLSAASADPAPAPETAVSNLLHTAVPPPLPPPLPARAESTPAVSRPAAPLSHVPATPASWPAPAASARDASQPQPPVPAVPDMSASSPAPATNAPGVSRWERPVSNVLSAPAPSPGPAANAPAPFRPGTPVADVSDGPLSPPPAAKAPVVEAPVSNVPDAPARPARPATSAPVVSQRPEPQPVRSHATDRPARPQHRRAETSRRPAPDIPQPPQLEAPPVPAIQVFEREPESRAPAATGEPEAPESRAEEQRATETLKLTLPAAAPAPLAVPAERPTPASRLPQPPTATRIDKPREEGAPAAKPVARVDAPESQLQPARAISPLPRRGIEAEARDAGPDAPPVHVRAVRSRPFGVPVHQELAFAARMKEDPAAETTGAHAPARHVPQPAPSVPVLRPEPSTPLEAPAELGVARPPTAFAVAVAPPETRPAAPDAPARPAAPVPPVAPEPLAVERPSAAARDIAIEVAGSNGRVEIRVAEREGEIRMAVHAPRGQLAGELRERLPELAHRLEQQGWSAETWHPERAAGPRSDSGTPGREAGSQSWGQAEDGRHGRQQQDRQPRPGWLAELEETEERSEPEWQAFQAG